MLKSIFKLTKYIRKGPILELHKGHFVDLEPTSPLITFTSKLECLVSIHLTVSSSDETKMYKLLALIFNYRSLLRKFHSKCEYRQKVFDEDPIGKLLTHLEFLIELPNEYTWLSTTYNTPTIFTSNNVKKLLNYIRDNDNFSYRTFINPQN